MMKAATPMTCRELVDFIADYRSDELDSSTRASFEAHLEACPSCVRYLRSYEDTIRLARRAFESPETPATAEAPAALIEAILESRRRDGPHGSGSGTLH